VQQQIKVRRTVVSSLFLFFFSLKKLLLWNSKAIERGTVRITYKEPDRAEEKSESDNNNKNEGAGFSAWARSTEITKPKTPRPSSFI
jgi:hypothetical protein